MTELIYTPHLECASVETRFGSSNHPEQIPVFTILFKLFHLNCLHNSLLIRYYYLGRYHGAMLTNHEEWEPACTIAGRTSGDLVHPLLYCPELHFSEFASAVADMKNSSAVCVTIFY